MPNFQFFLSAKSNFFAFMGSSALVKALTIIIGTFILEDLTTVLTALAAQRNEISILLAIISLWIGITIGDALLYALGFIGAKRPVFQRFLKLSEINRGEKWFHENLMKIVVFSRFLPGLRLPFYTSCGFFRTPFLSFIQIVAISTCIWTIFLFFLSFEAGNWIVQHAAIWRWAGILGLLFGLYCLKRIVKNLKIF